MRARILRSAVGIVLAAMMACLPAVTVSAESSYIFNRVGSNTWKVMQTPLPYRYETSIYAADLGVDSLAKVSNLFTTDESIYITNGGNLIITDHDFNVRRILRNWTLDGETETLTDLEGIWVTEDGSIYVCEPQKSRILHYDADFNGVRVLGYPEDMVLSVGLIYQPTKVAVDSKGRIYIVANNIYEGIIECNPDGTFSRFFGAVKVRYTFMELFWRTLQTASQRLMSRTWLPVNFSYLTIDHDDFVYATVAGANESEPIRKLNAKGSSILRYPKNPDNPPRGEFYYNNFAQTAPSGPSMLTALDVTDYGLYLAFDTRRSHVFAYDDDGYNVFIFGESGTQKGSFNNVVDMRLADGDETLLFTDKGNMSIEVYRRTDYGRAIMEAARHHYASDYDAASLEWQKVVDMNPYFQYAYVGIGKALYYEGRYEEAMQYFKTGQDTAYYSYAFQKTRQAFVSRIFTVVLVVAAAVALLIVLMKMRKKRRRVNG